MADEFGTCNVRLGPVLIDVPRSIGYFGGVAAATALGLVDPPLAVFIAAVPLLKVFTHRSLPMPIRFVGETLEGASKPVGGDDDGYVKLEDEQLERERARAIAARARRGAAIAKAPRPERTGVQEGDGASSTADNPARLST